MNDALVSASLRRLQVFLAVCETMHVGRAAERLNIAQPALSQQIKGLEHAVGAPLFHRRKRGIDLTEAGHVCRREARRLLAAHDALIHQVQRAARGEVGRLNLGYVGSAMFQQQFPSQLKTMRDNAPDVEIVLTEGSVAELCRALDAGELDAALARGPFRVGPGIKRQLHSRQDLVVIMAPDHPMRMHDAIPTADLALHPMVGLPDTDEVGIMQIISEHAATAGIVLNVQWRASDIGSVVGLVAAGLGFSVVPRETAALARAGVISRPLAVAPVKTELWLLWHEDRVTPALERFFSTAKEPKRRSPDRNG